MKVIKSLAVAALMAVSTTASAQFTNTKSASSSSAGTEGWSTFYVQWNPSSINTDVKGEDDQSVTAFSIGYNKAFGIVQGTPLFIEAGLGLQYYFYTYEDENSNREGDIETKYSMLSAKVPVNLTYDFRPSNSNVSIAPYAGLNFRFNIIGKSKMEFNDEDTEDYYKDERDEKLDKNLFDKDDMGGKDYVWKRFQVGWQIGVNVRFNNSFLLGVSYGSDFSEIYKKHKVSTTSVTLGYCF